MVQSNLKTNGLKKSVGLVSIIGFPIAGCLDHSRSDVCAKQQTSLALSEDDVEPTSFEHFMEEDHSIGE